MGTCEHTNITLNLPWLILIYTDFLAFENNDQKCYINFLDAKADLLFDDLICNLFFYINQTK